MHNVLSSTSVPAADTQTSITSAGKQQCATGARRVSVSTGRTSRQTSYHQSTASCTTAILRTNDISVRQQATSSAYKQTHNTVISSAATKRCRWLKLSHVTCNINKYKYFQHWSRSTAWNFRTQYTKLFFNMNMYYTFWMLTHNIVSQICRLKWCIITWHKNKCLSSYVRSKKYTKNFQTF